MPQVGDWVLWRDYDSDRPAMVANVNVTGTLTLAILGKGGQWIIRTEVAHDRVADGGMTIQGMWRWKGEKSNV